VRYTLPSNKGEASIVIAVISFIGALTGLVLNNSFIFLASTPVYFSLFGYLMSRRAGQYDALGF